MRISRIRMLGRLVMLVRTPCSGFLSRRTWGMACIVREKCVLTCVVSLEVGIACILNVRMRLRRIWVIVLFSVHDLGLNFLVRRIRR